MEWVGGLVEGEEDVGVEAVRVGRGGRGGVLRRGKGAAVAVCVRRRLCEGEYQSVNLVQAQIIGRFFLFGKTKNLGDGLCSEIGARDWYEAVWGECFAYRCVSGDGDAKDGQQVQQRPLK